MSTSSFIKRAGNNLRKLSHCLFFFGCSRCIKSSERSSAQNLPSIQMVPDGESVNSRNESWQNSSKFHRIPTKPFQNKLHGSIGFVLQAFKRTGGSIVVLGHYHFTSNIRVNSTQGWLGTSCPDTFFIDPRVGELELNRNQTLIDPKRKHIMLSVLLVLICLGSEHILCWCKNPTTLGL